MREHESLGLRRQCDLGGLFRGRVPGVAGTLALLLAERCLVNQQIRFLCGIHRGSAGACVTGEGDDSAGPGGSDKAIGRQLSAVSKLDCLTLGEFAPEGPSGIPAALAFSTSKRPRRTCSRRM